MNPTIETARDEGEDGERTTLLIAYILYACTLFSGITAIIGVVINHLKVNATQSEFIRSHHRWLMRTFWWGLLWSLISSALTIILIGFAGYLLVAVWFIYRIVRGFLAYSERRAMPA